jgi:hypothetical protein
LRELLKPTQLRDLEEGAIHTPLLIEKDFDLPMALKSSNGIDRNAAFHFRLLQATDNTDSHGF